MIYSIVPKNISKVDHTLSLHFLQSLDTLERHGHKSGNWFCLQSLFANKLLDSLQAKYNIEPWGDGFTLMYGSTCLATKILWYYDIQYISVSHFKDPACWIVCCLEKESQTFFPCIPSGPMSPCGPGKPCVGNSERHGLDQEHDLRNCSHHVVSTGLFQEMISCPRHVCAYL